MTKLAVVRLELLSLACALLLVHGFHVARTPVTPTRFQQPHSVFRTSLALNGQSDDSDEDDENDGDDIDLLSDSDWRDFRAKLVMSETKQASPSTSTTSSSSESTVFADDGDLDGIGSIFQDSVTTDSKASEAFVSGGVEMTPLDPSQWAYDSGKIVEQGAVILGGVEQEYGFGLRQQYFHKAAILVLDHEESTFTKGIILNRPTDLTLEDDINEGVRWRVWFGGVRSGDGLVFFP
jgi:hypothetical protein